MGEDEEIGMSMSKDELWEEVRRLARSQLDVRRIMEMGVSSEEWIALCRLEVDISEKKLDLFRELWKMAEDDKESE